MNLALEGRDGPLRLARELPEPNHGALGIGQYGKATHADGGNPLQHLAPQFLGLGHRRFQIRNRHVAHPHHGH